jgi:hypothetical protein
MPTFRKTAVARTITSGQSQDYPLDQPGSFPLRCGFTAPCGRTEVMVMLHALHATSDAEGRFRMQDVPADEPFVISAWHPLFQEAKADVRVAPGETKQIELVLTPLPAAAGGEDGEGSEAAGKQQPGGKPPGEPSVAEPR